MTQDIYCFTCGSLLENQSTVCSTCGRKTHSSSEQTKKPFIPFNIFFFFILIASILSPTFNILITAYFDKYQTQFVQNFNYILNFTAMNILNFIVTIIIVIFLATKGYLITNRQERMDYVLFAVKIFLISLIGSSIYILLNSFILVPYINSIHTNNSITFSPYTINELINAIPVFLFTSGLFYTMVSIFSMIFYKQVKSSRDFETLHYTIYFIIIGFLIGVLQIVLSNTIRKAIVFIPGNLELYISIINLINILIIILIPTLFVIILVKFIHISYPRLIPYFIVLIFLFALIGGSLGYAFINNGNLLNNSQIPLFNIVIYFLSNSLYGSLFGTIVFFAVLFLFQAFSAQTSLKTTNFRFNFSEINYSNIKSVFKKPSVNNNEIIDINPALEKIESILKENTDYQN